MMLKPQRLCKLREASLKGLECTHGIQLCEFRDRVTSARRVLTGTGPHCLDEAQRATLCIVA